MKDIKNIFDCGADRVELQEALSADYHKEITVEAADSFYNEQGVSTFYDTDNGTFIFERERRSNHECRA